MVERVHCPAKSLVHREVVEIFLSAMLGYHPKEPESAEACYNA